MDNIPVWYLNPIYGIAFHFVEHCQIITYDLVSVVSVVFVLSTLTYLNVES